MLGAHGNEADRPVFMAGRADCWLFLPFSCLSSIIQPVNQIHYHFDDGVLFIGLIFPKKPKSARSTLFSTALLNRYLELNKLTVTKMAIRISTSEICCVP